MTDRTDTTDPRICHICGKPVNGPGLSICSYPHPDAPTQTTELPSISSLRGWNVGVTDYNTLEVRLTLSNKQEARAWAVWLAERWEEIRGG